MIRLRIGGVPEHYNMPWHMAMASDDPGSLGIDCQWTDYYEGTGGMIQALRDDALDLAILLTEGAISGISRDAPYRIVSFYTDSPLVWGIHVPAESSLEDVNEIHHHRYAISRYGSGSHLMAYVHARAEQWPLHKLQFRVIDTLDGARLAFRNGQADVFFWEKYTTKPYVDNGEFRRIGEYPTPWPGFVIVASDRTLMLHAERVQALLKVVFKHAQLLSQSPYRVSRIASSYELEEDDVRAWLSYTRWCDRVHLEPAILENTTDTLKELGLVHQLFEPKQLYWAARDPV